MVNRNDWDQNTDGPGGALGEEYVMETRRRIEKERKYPLIFIMPTNTLPQIWESIINTSTIISLVMVPYVLVFGLEDNYRNLGTTVDVIFFLDIIFTFITGYYVGNKLITRRKKIAFRYLTTYFIFDIVSTVPSLVTGQKSIYAFKLLRFVHFNRLFVQLDFVID